MGRQILSTLQASLPKRRRSSFGKNRVLVPAKWKVAGGQKGPGSHTALLDLGGDGDCGWRVVSYMVAMQNSRWKDLWQSHFVQKRQPICFPRAVLGKRRGVLTLLLLSSLRVDQWLTVSVTSRALWRGLRDGSVVSTLLELLSNKRSWLWCLGSWIASPHLKGWRSSLAMVTWIGCLSSLSSWLVVTTLRSTRSLRRLSFLINGWRMKALCVSVLFWTSTTKRFPLSVVAVMMVFRLPPKRSMLQWKIIFLGLVNLSPPVDMVAPFRILCWRLAHLTGQD